VSTKLRTESATLWRLAGPLIVAQLSQVGMGFTDTVMAGRLSPLDLAAVALGSMLLLSVFLVFFGILNSVSPTVAQLKGARRDRDIGRVFHQGLWLAGTLGVISVPATIYSALLMRWAGTVPDVAELAGSYLFAVAWGMPATCIFLVARFLTEGTGHTRPVMYINVFGLGLNALANYAFMYGKLGAPAMGAVGCGVATTIVMWVDLVLLMLYLVSQKRYHGYRLFSHWSAPQLSAIVSLVRLGTPIALGIMTEVLLFLAVGLLMSRLGAVAMAGHQIAINFASLSFMVPLSIGMAILIRVGHLVGAGDPGHAEYTSYVGVGMAGAFMACMAIVIFTVPEAIVRLYTDAAPVTAIALELLFFAAIFQISDGLNIALVHALRGLKDAFVPMLLGLVSYWLVGFAAAWYIGIHSGAGAGGLWMGLIAGLSVSCVLVYLRLRVVFSRHKRAAVAA
jgi:MATE family multidrug resistance protein